MANKLEVKVCFSREKELNILIKCIMFDQEARDESSANPQKTSHVFYNVFDTVRQSLQ